MIASFDHFEFSSVLIDIARWILILATFNVLTIFNGIVSDKINVHDLVILATQRAVAGTEQVQFLEVI